MKKNKHISYIFYACFSLLLTWLTLLGFTYQVQASNEYQLGSEQELFHFIYTKNNVYSVSNPTEQNVLAFHPLMENDVTLRNPIPVPVSYLLNVDELYGPGEFFTVYSDLPMIQKNTFDETNQDVIDVTRIQLENAVGDPVDTIRQGRPYKGALDLVIHTEKLSGALHSIFYKLPGQLDSIGTDPVLLKTGDETLGKIYQSKSGDRYFQIDFDETKLDGLGDLQVTLPIQVRARPEIKAGMHSIAFARNQAQKINIEPYDPGIFSWVDVNQYANQPMNQARAQSAVKWESDNSFTNFVIADLYPDAIRRDHPKFQGYDKMAFPTFFYGVDSSGTTYYPDEVGLCIDPFHTITQSNAPLFKAQIEDFIMDEGARKLNLSLHMAAWRAQTAHDDPMQVLSSKDPIKGVQPLKYDVTNFSQQYIKDRKDTGRRWMGGGQIAAWLFSMKYNRDNNNRIDNIVDPEGINYNTKYFWPNAWKQEIDYKPDLTILSEMRHLYEDTSYITEKAQLLSKTNAKVVMEVPNSNQTSGLRGFENITYTQRDFDHYIDIEASKAASKRKDKNIIDNCLDIKQEYQDIYEKKTRAPYIYYNRSNNVAVKQTKVGEPFTKLEVTAKCDLNPGDVKLVIRKNTRDFWNDSIGYTASVANGRQFVGMFAIPPSYRPSGELDFYTGNGSVNLVKYDEENPPSSTNEGTRLNGAEFELYDATQSPAKKIGTYTTEDHSSVGQNGVIIVNNLPPGDYYFIETKPPKGYEANPQGKYPFTIQPDTFETVASSQNQVNGEVFIINGNIPVLGVPNKKIPDKEGEVEIEKISSEDGQHLSDAVFMLYEEDAKRGTEVISAWNQPMRFTPVENKPTNSNGSVTFDHLVYGRPYMIKEVEAPDGYQLNEKNVCVFKLTDQGIDYGTNHHCFDRFVWTVENEPTGEEPPDEPEGEIEFEKYGREVGAGQPNTVIGPLFNVRFGIYDQEDDEFVKSVFSNMRGEVSSGRLPPGSYYFKELATLPGYELSDTEIPFTIDHKGEAYFEGNVLNGGRFYNDKPRADKGDLVIKKYDADSLGKKLEGAEFKLCPNSPTSPQCKQIGKTNASGELRVKDLEVGTYYLIETKAPEGYDLDDRPIKVEITADKLSEGTIYQDVTNEKTPIRDFEFQKIDKKENGLPGAEFTLQKETQPGVWTDTGDTYITDSYGFIRFEEEDIAQLGAGNYRFKETKAPEGYQLPKGDNIYSSTFSITKDNVTPRSVTMENKRLDHELILQKKVENDWASPANVIFVVQARKGNGQWERFGTDSFMTNASGQIKVNNDTAPGLIDDMLSSYESGAKTEFRFREAIVPPASKLEDPQYLGTSEPPGDPGDRFSVLIPIEDVKKANDRGENYKTPPQHLITLTDKIIRYRLSFTKKDSMSDKLINGAEFTLEEYAPGVNPLENKTPPIQSWVLTPNSKGEYHQDGLLIDRTYILKETKAPENYGARSDFYLFKLNYEYVLFPEFEGIGEMQETMFVSVVHEDGSSEALKDAKDYLWDSNVNDKHLTFIDKNGDFKNTALPKIPVTGGEGLTVFAFIGGILTIFGYGIYLYIMQKIRRSE